MVETLEVKFLVSVVAFSSLYLGRMLVYPVVRDGRFGLVQPRLSWTLGSASGSWLLAEIVYTVLIGWRWSKGSSIKPPEAEGIVVLGMFSGIAFGMVVTSELLSRVVKPHDEPGSWMD